MTQTVTFTAPPFLARGPVSEQLLAALLRPATDSAETLVGFAETIDRALSSSSGILQDDDVQLSLLILHGLHYGSVVDADEEWEWHPAMVAARVAIEREFEWELRELAFETDVHPCEISELKTAEDVAAALFTLTKPTPGPSTARFIAKEATDEQVREFVILRSVYTLKEADALGDFCASHALDGARRHVRGIRGSCPCGDARVVQHDEYVWS